MMWDNWMMQGSGIWSIVMMAIVVIVMIAAILAVVFLIRLIINQSWTSQRKKETPLDILKKRYAAGEITKEEFEEKKRDLELG